MGLPSLVDRDGLDRLAELIPPSRHGPRQVQLWDASLKGARWTFVKSAALVRPRLRAGEGRSRLSMYRRANRVSAAGNRVDDVLHVGVLAHLL